MRRMKKSSRVCWANEANLCQVRVFQSEDCPSEVGQGPPNPREKGSKVNIVVSDGFPGSSVRSDPSPLSHTDVSRIPLIQWRTPPRFDLNFKCRVAAGEESEELEVQKHREMTVREAIYSHCSAVPSCPSVSLVVEAEPFDDQQTPVIPVIEVEEAAEMDSPYNETALNTNTNSGPAKLPRGPSPSETFGIPPSKPLLSAEPFNGNISDHTAGRDLDGPMVAAAAAATAIMQSKEPGSLIDSELLIKLLSNPKLVQQLMEEHGLASGTTAGTSGLKAVESSVPCPSSKGLFDESTIRSCRPINPGTGFIYRSSRVKDSPASSRTRAQVATAETRPTSAWDEMKQPLHFHGSTLVSLAQKSTSENIQLGNARDEAFPRPKNQPLAAKAKQVTAPIPLFSSTSNMPTQNSNYEDFQTDDAGNMPLLKAPDTLLSLNPDVLSKKSTGKHTQLADDGNTALPRPEKLAPATSIEIGAGSRSKTVASLLPLPRSNCDDFMKEHSQLADFGARSEPNFVKPSLAGSSIAKTGFRPKQAIPSVPLSSAFPDFRKNARERGPLPYTSFPEPDVEKQPSPFPKMQAESLVDKLGTAYTASHLGTSPVFESLANPKSVLAREPHAEVSQLKKLIDEHEFHNRAGDYYRGGFPAPSKPDMERIKKLIQEYGYHANTKHSIPGAQHPSFTLPSLSSGMVEPLMANFQSTELSSIAPCAFPSVTTTSVSLPKDVSYFQSLIKQHGQEKESLDKPSLYGAHNHVRSTDSDQKYKKPCKFYNRSKGCRNGSSCLYQHDDIPGLWMSDIVLETPDAKRTKLGGRFTGT